MPDVQILVTGSADAPVKYTVPNTTELIPKAVSAVFDGTGASGSFQPVVEIISDGGVVVAQSAGDTVAAGGSVEQSWFPGVGLGGSTVTAPNVATLYVSVAEGDSPITVPSGGVATGISWDHAQLPSTGSMTWSSGDPNHLYFTEPVITIEALYCGWDSGAYAKAGVIGTDSQIQPADMLGFSNAGVDTFDSIIIGYAWTRAIQTNAHTSAGAYNKIHTYLINGDTVSHDVKEAWLVVYAWPAPGYTGNIPGYPP